MGGWNIKPTHDGAEWVTQTAEDLCLFSGGKAVSLLAADSKQLTCSVCVSGKNPAHLTFRETVPPAGE